MISTTLENKIPEELQDSRILLSHDDVWYPVGYQIVPKSIFGGGGYMLYNSYNTKSTITTNTIYNQKRNLKEFIEYNKLECDNDIIVEDVEE